MKSTGILSTERNIIKRYIEFGEIYVHKGSKTAMIFRSSEGAVLKTWFFHGFHSMDSGTPEQSV